MMLPRSFYLNHSQLDSAMNKIDNLDSLQKFITDETGGEVEMVVILDTHDIGIVRVRLRYYCMQFDRMLRMSDMAAVNNADIYLRCECRFIAKKALEMFNGLDKFMEEQNESINKAVQGQITVNQEIANR